MPCTNASEVGPERAESEGGSVPVTADDDNRDSHVNYPAPLALTRSLRARLARHLGGWDSPTRSRLVAQGRTPSPDAGRPVSSQKSVISGDSGNLIVGVFHSIPRRHRGAERRVASRSLRRTRLRGRLTATRPCRETHRGLVGTPALLNCLWPAMDSRALVALGGKRSHALLPSLFTRFARSLRKGTPRYRRVEQYQFGGRVQIRGCSSMRPAVTSRALGSLAVAAPIFSLRSRLSSVTGRARLCRALARFTREDAVRVRGVPLRSTPRSSDGAGRAAIRTPACLVRSVRQEIGDAPAEPE